MLRTSWLSSKRTTRSPMIGKVNDTLESTWIGTMYFKRKKSMLLYVKESLIRFNHAMPRRLQDQPLPHIKPKYRQIVQYTKEEDSSTPLTAAKKKIVQEVLGVFLYYGRAIDSTMLAALGSIATQQASPTENTMRKIHQFLDYIATHPDEIITFSASDMVLAGNRDAS